MLDFFKTISAENILLLLVLYAFILYIITLVIVNVLNGRVGFKIYSSLFISSIVISAFILAFVVWKFTFDYSNFFIDNNLYIGLFILLIINLLAGIIFYLLLRNKTMRISPNTKYLRVSASKSQYHKNRFLLYRRYNKLQYFLLLFLIGLIGLVGSNEYKPKEMIALLMDNSKSMEKEIDEGREAMMDICGKLPNSVEIVFGTFRLNKENIELKKELKSIYSVSSRNELQSAKITSFPQPKDFRFYLKKGEPHLSNLNTPLSETIWALFLESTHRVNIDYKEMIIITDGDGYLFRNNNLMKYDLFTQKGSEGKSIMQFFDKVKIINLGGKNNNEFFSASPPGTVKNINNFGGYSKTVKETVKDLYERDWMYMWYFVIPVIIFISVILVSPLVQNVKR